MAKAFIGASGHKLYLGASKIKKAYIGNQRVYSAGNIVTYKVDGNTTYQEEVDSDASCLSPKTFTPTKTGWTFVGWREDSTADGTVLSSKTMGDEPITLYAVFKQNLTVKLYSSTTPTSIPKTRYYNNGNVLNPTCQFNQSVMSGWTARGWSTSSAADANVSYKNNAEFTISASVTLYGLYYQTIALTTVANGVTTSHTGTRYYSTSNTYVNPVFTVANASKTGAEFRGWSSNGTTTVWKTSISKLELTSNLKVYAVFKYSDVTKSLTIADVVAHSTGIGGLTIYETTMYVTATANSLECDDKGGIIRYLNGVKVAESPNAADFWNRKDCYPSISISNMAFAASATIQQTIGAKDGSVYKSYVDLTPVSITIKYVGRTVVG